MRTSATEPNAADDRAARPASLARPLLLLSALALAFGCSPRAAPPQPQAASAGDAGHAAEVQAGADAPRLVILISLDTLRADHMSLYGYPRFTTPVLDTFALGGVVFDDASSAAPWTLPSHASMLTGLYPLRHKVVTMIDALPPEVPTVASMLAAAGYETAAVVNSTWLKQLKFRLTRDFEKYLLIEEIPERRAPNTWVTDQAIEWLREFSGERLFLFMHYYDVHTDYASEPAYEKLFVDKDYHGKADGTSWQLTAASLEDEYVEMCQKKFDPAICRFATSGEPNLVDEHMVRLKFDAADVQHVIDLYDASVRQTDVELSRFFGFLDSQGLTDQALVIVTSDHGEEFHEHGRFEHFLPTHQEILHVPLIFRGPGVPKGVRVAAPVSLVDLVPTILQMVGAKERYDLDGRDLSPLWREAVDDPAAVAEHPSAAFEERYQFGEASGGVTYAKLMGDGIFPIFRSVRQGRYKLIHVSKPEQYLLYDLANDPREREDVSDAHPDVVAALKDVLEQRYAEQAATTPRDSKNRVELDPDEREKLRALGYVP